MLTTSEAVFTENVEISKGVFKDIVYTYVTKVEQLPEVLEWLKTLPVIGWDLETSGLSHFNDKIATMQLGSLHSTGPFHAAVFDVRCFTYDQLRPFFDLLESPKIPKLGQQIRFEYKFSRNTWGIQARNLADTQLAELVLRTGLFGESKGTGENRRAYGMTSMASLMMRYAELTIDKDKELRTSFYSTPAGKHSRRQVVYAAGDVIYPFVISAKQKVLVTERGLRGVLRVENELLPILAEIEFRGIGVDAAAWRMLWQEAIHERAKAEEALDNMFRPDSVQEDLFNTETHLERPLYPKKNEPLNYSSSEQVRWAIHAYCKRIGWPRRVIINKIELMNLKAEYGKWYIDKNAAKGKVVLPSDVPDWVLPEEEFCVLVKADTDTLILAKCRGQLPRDVVDALLLYSKHDIRCDSFGIEWLKKNVNPVTKRVHMEIHQALTNTGRLSSQPNLQNIPSDKRYRKCFVPKKGHIYAIADYSQQEPRLMAQLSNDPVYVNTYDREDDLYMSVCEAMLGYRPNLDTLEGALERQVFKIIVLSMAYRSGVNKLRDQLTLGLHKQIMDGVTAPPSKEYAAELHKRFFEVHEKVLEFQNQCSSQADPNNKQSPKIWDDMAGALVTYMRAPCGRLRFFPPESLSTYTEGPNQPIQGGSATMTKAAACLFQREVDARGWRDLVSIVNMVHDEIVVEAPEEIGQEVANLLQAKMVEAGKLYCPTVPIVAEFPKNSTGVVPFWTKAAPDVV